MHQRGSQVLKAAVRRDANPLTSLPPISRDTFRLHITVYGPHSRPPMVEPKRYKISATIQIQGEVTAEELRSIFLPVERLGGRVAINAETPEPKPELPFEDGSETDAYRRQLGERIRNMSEAYREKLGEPPPDLKGALGMWLTEFGEDALREGIVQTVRAGIEGQWQRYEWFRRWLRSRRSAKKRGL